MRTAKKKGAAVRLLFTLIATAVLMVATASVALAGAPGTNFPEQPGSHVANACDTVLSNPGTGAGGPFAMHASPTALAITAGLVADACFGGGGG
jgi:hypothetical protein